MKIFQDFFKGKGGKTALNGAALLLIAAFALFAFNGIFQRNADPGANEPAGGGKDGGAAPVSGENYEAALERRLEETLSQIDGVGKVRVMLTLSYGKEITVANDSVTSESDITEADAGGGTRTTRTKSADTKNVVVSDSPLILKETQPKVEGVIVVAEGGGGARVREAVTKAVGAVLGVEAHKIQVFKMKK